MFVGFDGSPNKIVGQVSNRFIAKKMHLYRENFGNGKLSRNLVCDNNIDKM